MARERRPFHIARGDVEGLERAIGAVIARHRRAKKLTQTEFGIEVDLERTFVSMIERGLRRPSIAKLFLIAAFFSLTASEFVREVEDEMTH